MNEANRISVNNDGMIYEGETVAGSIEINFKRVATWTLIFTNAFFVSYFFAKLFQWI